MKREIVDDIEVLVDLARRRGEAGGEDEAVEAAIRVEAWLATYQPNHLDEKSLEH